MSCLAGLDVTAMITNVSVACTGCGDSVRLRISIGHEDEQCFYFICPHCHSALRGALLTDPTAGELRGLIIDGREARFVDESDAVVNIVTDLPHDPRATSMEVFGGSPFIMHFQLLGEPYVKWAENRSTFLDVVRINWHDVVRWYGFYVRRDWARFDEHARRYWSDKWSIPSSMLDRHDVIHRALEVIFLPLFPKGEYVNWKIMTRQPINEASWTDVASFARGWTRNRDVSSVQQEIFTLLDHFVQLRWALLPGLLLQLYDAVGKAPDPTWRITRDDFRQLRDLYITIFETAHRCIPIVLAFDNTLRRGNPDRFPDNTSMALAKVQALRPVDREKLLVLFDPWGGEVRSLLNRKLRNAIGHGSVVHDLRTGRVVTRDTSIGYAAFVSLVGASIQVPLLCLDIIKLLLVMDLSR